MISLFSFPKVLQLLVVISPDWNASNGVLCRYQRNPGSLQWKIAGEPIRVSLGKNGMAWGRGLEDFTDQKGLVKREGDNRSPAGIFYVGPAYGDRQHQSHAQKMPFLFLDDDLECVDDPNSLYYNQFVDSRYVSDWKSSEKMKKVGPMYAMGLVVQHNLHPIQPGMGSAIFMHIWSSKGAGTAGCTAMEETDLNEIVSWLDEKQNPCLVQLPSQEYENRKSEWGLPELGF